MVDLASKYDLELLGEILGWLVTTRQLEICLGFE